MPKAPLPKMRLPRMALFTDPAKYTATPTCWLPRMVLAAATVVPPMRLPDELSIDTPFCELPSTALPVASVPIQLPSTTLPPPP